MRLHTLRRLFTLALVFIPAVVGCSGLLGVDDYESSSGELCDLLDRCYSDPLEGCRSHVDVSLDQAPSNDRAVWLAQFSDLACLNQCSNARRCLDLNPLCKSSAGSCLQKEDCCGFVKGKADCVGNVCCRTKGSECVATADCCNQNCINGRCGGVVCAELDAPCTNDFECCSGLCGDDLQCADPCSPNGFPCGAGSECCSTFCGPDNTCTEPGCTPAGKPCGAPGSAACCQDLECSLSPDGQTYCSPPSCLGFGVPCLSSDGPVPCCDGLVCNPSFGVCGNPCKGKDESCGVAGECCSKTCEKGVCGCHDGACTIDAECCSGKCIGFACAPPCKPFTPPHDACHVGAPLDPSANTCAAKICETDEFCCCQGWDELCVKAALSSQVPECLNCQ